ncbi:hypothetical protein XELAEV_18015197mg [Xenopus laevis]|uniref:Uncharacterized protein n=1 Tax=Xenopus laevis TaxID=8355 RepID=A0A974DHX4_XENLA|nr:hypothetical protein XELAEV_18015197mg [Xenopus laevis]
MADLLEQVRDRVLRQGSGWVEELLAELVPTALSPGTGRCRPATRRTAAGPARRSRPPSRLSPSPPRPNTRGARKRAATARSASATAKASAPPAAAPQVPLVQAQPQRLRRAQSGKRLAVRIPLPAPACAQDAIHPLPTVSHSHAAGENAQAGHLLPLAPVTLNAPSVDAVGDSDSPLLFGTVDNAYNGGSLRHMPHSPVSEDMSPMFHPAHNSDYVGERGHTQRGVDRQHSPCSSTGWVRNVARMPRATALRRGSRVHSPASHHSSSSQSPAAYSPASSSHGSSEDRFIRKRRKSHRVSRRSRSSRRDDTGVQQLSATATTPPCLLDQVSISVPGHGWVLVNKVVRFF